MTSISFLLSEDQSYPSIPQEWYTQSAHSVSSLPLAVFQPPSLYLPLNSLSHFESTSESLPEVGVEEKSLRKRIRRFTSKESNFIVACYENGLTPAETEREFFEKFGYKRKLASIVARIRTLTGENWTNKSQNRWTAEEKKAFLEGIKIYGSSQDSFEKISKDVFKGSRTSSQLKSKFRTLNPKFDKNPLTDAQKELILVNLKTYSDEISGRIHWEEMSRYLFEGKKSPVVLRAFYDRYNRNKVPT